MPSRWQRARLVVCRSWCCCRPPHATLFPRNSLPVLLDPRPLEPNQRHTNKQPFGSGSVPSSQPHPWPGPQTCRREGPAAAARPCLRGSGGERRSQVRAAGDAGLQGGGWGRRAGPATSLAPAAGHAAPTAGVRRRGSRRQRRRWARVNPRKRPRPAGRQAPLLTSLRVAPGGVGAGLHVESFLE